MNPKSTIVFKSALGYFLIFLVVWLLIVGGTWIDPDKTIVWRGLWTSFLVLQIPTVILTLIVKFRLDKDKSG